jgi:flagellar hook protein FlgE
MMRTGVSGMNAQANRLSAVSDNIANSNTTGYKRSGTEFSTLVVPQATSNYISGGVTTNVRYAISQQGDLRFTTSTTDLAVNGNGFMIVQDSGAQPYLTRAGSFVPDDNGNLVNAAGFTLMGYSYENGIPSANANGFGGLVPVNVKSVSLAATPSTAGVFTVNLPADAADVPGANVPSTNSANASYTSKSSLVSYDNLGRKVLLDVYSTKTADNTWEVSVYNQADAAPNTSFPYSSPALATETLSFDGVTGQLTTGSAKTVTLTVPGGQGLTLDLSKTTQLAQNYTINEAKLNGSAPSSIDSIEIAEDGNLYAKYGDGTSRALYRIPMATVTSPDQLTTVSGNVYTSSYKSGPIQVGFPGEAGYGDLVSSALESSNVDVADELTTMIESQRTYTANSKVFQTGADLMDILVNLKR